jgi:CRP-like cAMP-binding protein
VFSRAPPTATILETVRGYVETKAARSDLASFDLLNGLDPAAVKRMLRGVTAVRLAQGDLLDVTESGAACCVVRSGRLALDFDEEDAERHRTVTLLEEGDVLLPASESWASVGPRVRGRALEPSVVLVIDRARFEGWLTEPRIAANLVRVLAAQIADRELAVAIALEPRVERRLLLKLRQLAERFGRVTPQGVRLDLRLTHQQLAEMVGAVRESVTIALGKLVQSEEITIESRTIWIHPAGEADPET